LTTTVTAELATAICKAEGITCPECGSSLQVVTDGLVGELRAPAFFTLGVSRLEYVMRPAPFVACTGCEFCLEIGPS